MSVIVVGLSHRSAPIELLERFAVGPDQLAKALHGLTRGEHVSEAVVLSTCNRTEVYAYAERFHGAVDEIVDFLVEHAELPRAAFEDHVFSYYETATAAHLFSVAAGLDSDVLGESEILGQVKAGWHASAGEGSSGPGLDLLFRHALEAAKRVRSDTGIGRHTASVPQAAVALAAGRLDGLRGRRVLVLGAGEAAEGMAVALAGAGVTEVVVANRSAPAAEALAERVHGRAIGLEGLVETLIDVDLLLTSTGAPTAMVGLDALGPVVERRGGRPLLIVDVAVPRDVDPAVAELEGVTLLDMDDLRSFADAGVALRRAELGAARDVVDEEVARYRSAATARLAAPLVTSLRERVEELRAAEVDRVVGGRADVDRELLDEVTRVLLNKLLHEPTIRVKDAAGTAKGERLAEALRELFDL